MRRFVCVASLLALLSATVGCAFQEPWHVTSSPRGADVYMDGEYMGKTDLQTTVHTDWATWIFGVPYTVKIEKEGYEPQVVQLRDTSHQFFPNFHAKLTPVGMLPKVTSTASEPIVFVDDTLKVTEPPDKSEEPKKEEFPAPKVAPEPVTEKTSVPSEP